MFETDFRVTESLGARQTTGMFSSIRAWAVLHLGGWVALGMDVGDLLQLESPFERYRKLATAAEVEGVAVRPRSASAGGSAPAARPAMRGAPQFRQPDQLRDQPAALAPPAAPAGAPGTPQ